MTVRQYSDLFSCIYDQDDAVGVLGRGTHYSVMRTSQPRDEFGAVSPTMRVQDFAVVWDEDHDERIIQVLERIHLGGLLWPIIFAGERKGGLTLLASAQMGWTGSIAADYKNQLQQMCSEVNGDSWNVEVGYFHRDPSNVDDLTNPEAIINDKRNKVVAYLQSIDVLWDLGLKERERCAFRIDAFSAE